MSADFIAEQNDKVLDRLEKRCAEVYKDAYKSTWKKLRKYLADFERLDRKKKKQVRDGKITEKEYRQWRFNKMAMGEKYQDLVDVLRQDFTNSNIIAAGIMRDNISDVFANSANYTQYEIDQKFNIDTTYSLYDRDAVARLLRDTPDLLPQPKVNIPLDLQWNKGKISSAIARGLLSGDSIPKIANRLRSVTDMNRNSAIRNARTAVTGRENAGRQDRYNRAAERGLPLVKKWIATLDGRTRHDHGMADGQEVGLKEKFNVGGYKMMYPGDPSAPPQLVYNCRCTMVTQERSEIIAEPRQRLARDENGNWITVTDMNYAQWQQKYGQGNTAKNMSYAQWKSSKSSGIINDSFSPVETNTSKSLKTNGVKYNEVRKRAKTLTEQEIITEIAGGDKTPIGSCASVALAYVGQKNGWSVLDFRGGASMYYFANKLNKIRMFQDLGATIIPLGTAKTNLTNAKRMLGILTPNVEYYFQAGRHAAIVRNNNGTIQYLELQSPLPSDNGWKDFGNIDRTLVRRFGCSSSSKYYSVVYATDISQLKGDDFRTILGYLNTDEKDQQKGVTGSVR